MLRSRLFMAGAITCVLAVLPGAARAATPNTWRAGPFMTEFRSTPSLATLADGRVLFIADVGDPDQTVDAYSPATNSIAAVASLNVARDSPLAVSLGDGRVLAAGGADETDQSAEIYDPNDDAWTPIPDDMNAIRTFGTAISASVAAPLPGGEALLAGGEDAASPVPTAGADIFDPSLNSGSGGFTAAAAMSTPRIAAAAAALPGGDVLVAGGSDDGSHALATGEVYHPSSNSWTPVANQMATSHLDPSIAPLPGGKVLIFGGLETLSTAAPSATSDSEIYDPATNQFTPTGPTVPAIALASVAPLPDGRVVAAGGESITAGGVSFGGTQVYEPTVNGWVPAASPLGFTLEGGVPLPSGEVLTTMAAASSGFTGTEIYTPATIPGAPTEVGALAADGEALVTWAPATDNGRPITHYVVSASNGATATTVDGRQQATIAVPNGAAVSFTVTAANDLGSGPVSAPSAAVTPSASIQPDTTAPTLKITGLKSKLKLKSFLKALTATVKPSEPASLAITLYGSAKRVTIAKAYNVILASKSYGRSASARKLKLKPSKKLVGHAKKFTVRLKIVATDAAGNTRTVTKTVRVSG